MNRIHFYDIATKIETTPVLPADGHRMLRAAESLRIFAYEVPEAILDSIPSPHKLVETFQHADVPALQVWVLKTFDPVAASGRSQDFADSLVSLDCFASADLAYQSIREQEAEHLDGMEDRDPVLEVERSEALIAGMRENGGTSDPDLSTAGFAYVLEAMPIWGSLA